MMLLFFFCRIMTFSYLAAFNWWLLLCPATLSHDWQMGSVPLVTSLSDSRNVITCLFLGLAILLAVRSIADFEVCFYCGTLACAGKLRKVSEFQYQSGIISLMQDRKCFGDSLNFFSSYLDVNWFFQKRKQIFCRNILIVWYL